MLTVYSKNHCPFCDQAKALLTKWEVPFEEVKIDTDTSARDFVVGAGHRTVPQIYHEGKLFVEGGFQGLSKLNADNVKERLGLTNLGTL
jgi:glutaredoxin